MKDSRLDGAHNEAGNKHTKVNNERLSNRSVASAGHKNIKQILKDS
mgnify:CR=1 FL=1